MIAKRHAACCAVLLLCSSPAPAQELAGRWEGTTLQAPPLEIAMQLAPAPLPAGGKRHLVYELRLTNFGAAPVALRRIDVLAGEGAAAAPIAAFTGGELNAALGTVGAPAGTGTRDQRDLGPGATAVAFLWVTLDRDARPPAALRHRVVTDDGQVEGGAAPLAAGELPVLGPPLAGGLWLAGNGPHNASGHRRALMAVDGAARIAQRYAIDWVRLAPDGRTFDGDRADNRAYRAYGAEILAVADGTVAAVHDGIPDNVPGFDSRAVPITLATIAGNHVILDVGAGRFAVYAHLQPGSVRVAPGERVRRGQVLGLVGNSGNSTEPHLHFHLSDAPSVLAAEGVPYVLDAFTVTNPDGTTTRRTRELPLRNAVITF